jgi:hypothetical protein
MRHALPRSALAALAGIAAGVALAQPKPSTAECTMLLDPFRNKANAAVKDEEVTEYAPLVKAFWEKGCPAQIYDQEIKDAALKQRIEAAAPRR